MKKLVYILFCVLIGVSCKDSGSGSGRKSGNHPAVSGKLNQVVVIISNNQWEGAVGDSIKTWFGQDYEVLPQSEPIFDLMHLPKEHFNKEIKSHRNILQVNVSPNVDSSAVIYTDSPWANTQKLVRIDAKDRDDFFRLFNENKIKITSNYARAERDRLVSIYKRTADSRIFSLMKNKHQLLLYPPTGYYIRKDTTDFTWISSETAKFSQGVFVFTSPYENEGQLNHVVLMDDVNEKLKSFVPASVDGSYMAIDPDIPITLAQYQYQGHYALMIRGLWTAVNDYMAGPFVLNVVLDEKNNRIVYTMGYVYYPSEPKRNLMKQVEAILQTMSIDFKEETKAK